jgi:uncharacterized coiled-coil DUF342 family protein
MPSEMKEKEDIEYMNKKLQETVEKIKKLKKKRNEIKRQYTPYVKNKLDGYAILFGERGLRSLGRSKEPWQDYYKKLFFEDIKYRSKLRKIRDKISLLENEYNGVLSQIKCLKNP